VKTITLFVVALLCLLLQPPVESDLGQLPLPAAVGMNGEIPADTPAESQSPVPNVELSKYAVTQGGLAVVCLVMFFYNRRDYIKRARDERNEKQLLVELVQQNTVALTTQTETTSRVARALEMLQLR
jgi:hypothetical protein